MFQSNLICTNLKDIRKGKPAQFYIAHHHFPIQLWQANKKCTVFMNKQEVTLLDSNPSVESKGYGEKCNKVIPLMKGTPEPLTYQETADSRYKDMHVQVFH